MSLSLSHNDDNSSVSSHQSDYTPSIGSNMDSVRKRMKFDSSQMATSSQNRIDAAKIRFPNCDKQFELISVKAENAKLQIQINSLRQELFEVKSQQMKEKDEFRRQKEDLESASKALNRKKTLYDENERQLKRDLALLREKSEKKEQQLYDNVSLLTKTNMNLLTQRDEAIDELNKANLSEHRALMSEKHESMENGFEIERLSKEALLYKQKVGTLRKGLTAKTIEVLNIQRKYDEQSIALRSWRQENQIATALRYDVADMKILKEGNESLKQQLQRHINLMENTCLLKNDKQRIEDELERMKKTLNNYMDENNELKIALSQYGQNDQHREYKKRTSLCEVDAITERCIFLKNELSTAQNTIAKLQSDFDDLQNRYIDSQNQLVHLNFQLNENKQLELQKICIKEEICSIDAEIQTEKFEPDLVCMMTTKDEELLYLKKKLGLLPDYDPHTTEILHLLSNPLENDHNAQKEEMLKLKQENVLMKLREEEMGKCRNEGTSDAPFVGDITLHVQQKIDMQQKQAEIEDLKTQVLRLVEQRDRTVVKFREITAQYREVCTHLTGYQMKMQPDGKTVFVQSSYERAMPGANERYFNIQVEGENYNLMGSDYVKQFEDMAKKFIELDKSYPAFFAAVALSLHERNKNQV